MSNNPAIAVDKSMRRLDVDGHMHVEMTNISKANVCPYYGREIPDWKDLRLDPDRVYMLWRHPEELKAAAHTFAGKPLLIHHRPVTSDEHPPELVVGTVGTTVEFTHPYLRAPLSVWTQEAIDAINARDKEDRQRELSPGYRYKADMTPGRTPEGVAFDGIMRNIMGNHVALVREGRTGPDVFVADEAPRTMKFPKILAALAAVFPSMTATQAFAMDTALDAEFKGKKALDEYGLTEDEAKAALDKYAKDTGRAMDSFTDEDRAEAYKRAAKDKAPPPLSGKEKPAMDEAAVAKAIKDAVTAATVDMVPKATADKMAQDAATAADAAARTTVHALYSARKAVEPVVGITTLETQEATFRFALDHLKVEHKDIPATALPALFESSAKVAGSPPIATDGAPTFDPSILGLSHIRKG